MNRGLAGVLLIALVAAGCSTSTSEKDPSDDGDTTPSVGVSASPDERSPILRQYASIVAGSRTEMRTTMVAMERSCDWGSAPVGGPACITFAQTLNYQATTLAATLHAAGRRGVPGYVGQPPRVIASLVRRTVASARAVSRAQKEIPDRCVADAKVDTCASLGIAFHAATSDLKERLNSWDPYF